MTQPRHPAQPWLQISIAHAAPEQVEAYFEDHGALAVTLRDGGDEALIEPEPGASPLWKHTEITGLFAAHTDPEVLLQGLPAWLECGEMPPWRAELVEDRDWVRAWLDDYRPMRFGKQLWVCPRHETVHADNAVVLRLDPGLAFGTGSHASTAMCLEWLDANAGRQQSVLDYGCGSGILAIAAALLGARQVVAVDIDPQALQATRENAENNRVGQLLRVCKPEELGEHQVDLVLANILAAPLISLAPELAGLCRPGGRLVLAGLLEDQVESVVQAYRHWFDFEPARLRDGWACLAASRGENDSPAIQSTQE